MNTTKPDNTNANQINSSNFPATTLPPTQNNSQNLIRDGLQEVEGLN